MDVLFCLYFFYFFWWSQADQKSFLPIKNLWWGPLVEAATSHNHYYGLILTYTYHNQRSDRNLSPHLSVSTKSFPSSYESYAISIYKQIQCYRKRWNYENTCYSPDELKIPMNGFLWQYLEYQSLFSCRTLHL